jgi:hypothetical protein
VIPDERGLGAIGDQQPDRIHPPPAGVLIGHDFALTGQSPGIVDRLAGTEPALIQKDEGQLARLGLFLSSAKSSFAACTRAGSWR